jgi:predicted regulator of amino acid metabolism with ACT domain
MYVEDEALWRKIAKRLSDYPVRIKVAKAFIELGLSVKEDGKIYCGPIEMAETKIARALDVDRRVVKETAGLIASDEMLAPIFVKLRPAGPFLADIAKFLGYMVIEIYADSSSVGIIANASSIIAGEGISIRQAVADDPDLVPDPKLTIVADKEVSGAALEKILKISGVKKLTAY